MASPLTIRTRKRRSPRDPHLAAVSSPPAHPTLALPLHLMMQIMHELCPRVRGMRVLQEEAQHLHTKADWQFTTADARVKPEEAVPLIMSDSGC